MKFPEYEVELTFKFTVDPTLYSAEKAYSKTQPAESVAAIIAHEIDKNNFMEYCEMLTNVRVALISPCVRAV